MKILKICGIASFLFLLNFPAHAMYMDPETGTMYNRYRDYNPKLGRFIESDPIGLAGGINTYGYVNANPLTNIDPKGLECETINGTVKCWASASERQFLNNGDYYGYYQQACMDGDTYACFAEHIPAVDNTEGLAARQWLAFNRYLSGNQCLTEKDYNKSSSDLAYDYANYLPQSEANAITPSASAIAQFHWQEFAKFGLPPMTFGGTPFGKSGGTIGTNSWWPYWCPDCGP